MSRTRPQRRPATPSLLDAITAVQRAAGATDLAPPVSPVDLETMRDARGYRRTIATTREFHLGREPKNKGESYEPDPPTVEEIFAMLAACPNTDHGRRVFAAIMLLWQGALRSFEALAITERDLDERAGRVFVRHGKGDKPRTIALPEWAWPLLEDWRTIRPVLPNPSGPLLCVIEGRTAGRAWAYSDLNRSLKKIARAAGITKRMSPHQLRHAWASWTYLATRDPRLIQMHLGHDNLGTTEIYLRSLGVERGQDEIYRAPVPTIPATALLQLTAAREGVTVVA